MNLEEYKKKKLKAIDTILSGGLGDIDKMDSVMYKIHYHLMCYLFKVCGKSSRQQAKEYNEAHFPESISHTKINEEIQKGEEYFKQLSWIMLQITEGLRKNKTLAKTMYFMFESLAELEAIEELYTEEQGKTSEKEKK